MIRCCPPPNGATTIEVRHLQALLTLGQQTVDDLLDLGIWWLNCHEPDQGQVWVPHLAWAHTLIARRPSPDLHPTPEAVHELHHN